MLPRTMRCTPPCTLISKSSNQPRSSSMINHFRLESDEDTLDAKSLPPSEKTLPFRDEDDALRYPQLDLDPLRLLEMRRDETAMGRYCQ